MKEPRSFFEQEAERIRQLNKDKDGEKVPLSSKILAIVFGVLVAAVAFVFLVLPLSLYYILSYAYVASNLWAWFVVPTFGVEQLKMVPIIGIMMLIRVCTFQIHINTNKDERSTTEKIAHTIGLIVAPWFTLLMGYIIHLFM